MARILVVDDEPLARFTIREILKKARYEVVEAGNGQEAIARQKATPCELVITDIIMPEKEGIQTIRELRAMNPDTKIIAISGGGRTRNLDFLKMAMEMGADRVIAKPFSMDELLMHVAACLAGPGAAQPPDRRNRRQA